MSKSISEISKHYVTSHLYRFHVVFFILGIVRSSQNYSAMEMWALTAHLRAVVSFNFKVLCSVNSNSNEKKISSKTIEESCLTI